MGCCINRDMNSKQIEARMTQDQRKLTIKFEAAKQIREILDGARKAYGADDADMDDLESGILELVTEE